MTSFTRNPCRILAAAVLSLAATAASAESLTVGGTGSALATLRILAAEFAKVAPAHSVHVVPNLGGGGSMKALAAGAVDMAVVGRPLKDEEVAQGLVGLKYGKTALVIATSSKGAGTVRSLTELSEIYAGRRTTWPGGEPVRLILRPAGDIDTQLLQAFSPDMKLVMPGALARPGMVIAATDQEAVDFIEGTPGAIGPTSLSQVRTENRNVRILPLNGVVPSPRTLADGSYPYAKEMLLARRSAATPGVIRFFEFVASAQGRQILADTGHWVAGAPSGH